MNVGRYQLRECVGHGAMADVYRAYDPGINRDLAVKVLKPELRQNKQLVLRFLREAKAAGALSHPNIVTVFDVGEADGNPYIAMELLDGAPLDVAVKKAKPSIENVIAIGLQLASALNYAHSNGIVHRDVKPSNIMLAGDLRTIKVLDFGIAHLGEHATDAGDALKTQFGQVVGTPRYMSPEQALGQPVDQRSDLFSVGVVLYELVTGQKPFSSDNATSLAVQIALAAPTPIEDLAPRCPVGLRHIINRLLDKRPERRFASGQELADALSRELRLFSAATQQDSGRRVLLSLRAKLAIGMAAITATVLGLCLYVVAQREYDSMQRMSLAAGSSISSFIAQNVALLAVDNAARPEAERDWLPLEAFVRAAAVDSSLEDVVVADVDGRVRAATNAALIGKLYAVRTGDAVTKTADLAVIRSASDDGVMTLHFVRDIIYAGRKFGTVDIAVSQAELVRTGALSLSLFIALGVLVAAVVVVVSYSAVRSITQPLQRLHAALKDAGNGDLNVRVSHMRKDEIGDLFDAFNAMADSVQRRMRTLESKADGDAAAPDAVVDLDKTRIAVLPQAVRLERDETLAEGLVRWVRRRIA